MRHVLFMLILALGFVAPDNVEPLRIELPAVKHRNGKDKKSSKLDGPTVSTVEGTVRGVAKKETDGFQYYSFMGIPYGQVKKRFKSSVMARPWKGILDATRETEVCVQRDTRLRVEGGSEKCLHINVHTPTLDTKAGLGVLVLVHGGWFEFGSSRLALYHPRRLLRKGILHVAMNYRLGSFGFLNVGPKEDSNVALGDVVLALRWVRRNIARFGGDPERVTLYGPSSGAMLVDLLTLTRAAEGLYRGVILHGATTGMTQAIQRKPLAAAWRLASEIRGGPVPKSPGAILRALRRAAPMDLVHATERMEKKQAGQLPSLMFAPSVDKVLVRSEPYEMAVEGDYPDVPVLFLFADRESLVLLEDGVQVEGIVGALADTVLRLPFVGGERVAHAALDFYLRGRPIDMDSAETLFDMLADAFAIYPAYKILKARHSSAVYVVQFAYDNDYGAYHKATWNVSGVGHVEDLPFIFDTFLYTMTDGVDLEVRTVADRLITLIVNFVNASNPTPDTSALLPVKCTPLANDTTFDYLRLSTTVEMLKDPMGERIEFWNDVYAKNPPFQH